MNAALYRTLLSGIVTRGRVLALAGMAALPLLLAVALRSEAVGRTGAVYALVRTYGLGLLVPVVSLVLASAVFGDMVDDRSLVYLWLKPVPRWRMAVAGYLAALTVALPLAVLPSLAAPVIAGVGSRLAVPAAAAAALACAGYAAVFLGLGFRVRRALVWGLAYVLIWEGAVARVARGAARASVQVQALSVLAELSERAPPANAVAVGTALVVMPAVSVAALAITARWLSTADVP